MIISIFIYSLCSQAQLKDSTLYPIGFEQIVDFSIPDSLIHAPLPPNVIPGKGFEIDGKFFTVWLDGQKVSPDSKDFFKIIEAHKSHLGEFANIGARKEYTLIKLKNGKTQLREEMILMALSYMEDVIVPYEGEELFSTLLKRELERDCLIPKNKQKIDLIFTINDFKIEQVAQPVHIFKKYKRLYESYNNRRIIEGLKIEVTLELIK